mmetsp:Transcript_103733/g.268479  ORF Transcript_103733/g.268479 Transcript_103733/m.268479 type:complete len:202 (+) Transcript_103733:2035-2640(+)
MAALTLRDAPWDASFMVDLKVSLYCSRPMVARRLPFPNRFERRCCTKSCTLKLEACRESETSSSSASPPASESSGRVACRCDIVLLIDAPLLKLPSPPLLVAPTSSSASGLAPLSFSSFFARHSAANLRCSSPTSRCRRRRSRAACAAQPARRASTEAMLPRQTTWSTGSCCEKIASEISARSSASSSSPPDAASASAAAR